MLKYLKRLFRPFWTLTRCWTTSLRNNIFNDIWAFTNIYPTARLGINNSIGSYTEIGNEVWIGDNNRIGAKCFIPEGVNILHNTFIGPCVIFTNDKYPPGGHEKWQNTFIESGASIGAGCVILPVTIGENALIGAGSVVTHDVPSGEKWFGVPAIKMGKADKRVEDKY